MVNAYYQCIAFQKLDFDELNATDAFYAADVAIVDMSIQHQQHPLFYRLGIRDSFGMKNNIILYNDESLKVTIANNLPISDFKLISYRLSNEDKKCYVTEAVTEIKLNSADLNTTTTSTPLTSETKILLSTKLRNLMKDVQILPK